MSCFEVAFFDQLSFCASIAALKSSGICSFSTGLGSRYLHDFAALLSLARPFLAVMARKWRPLRNLVPIGTVAQEYGDTPVTKTERYTFGGCYNWRNNILSLTEGSCQRLSMRSEAIWR
jgi:hypothetical protein